MPLTPNVLVVEANRGHFSLIEEKFKTSFPEARISQAKDLREATKTLPEKQWDLVVLSDRLPDGRGIDFLDLLAVRQPFAAVVVLTEDAEEVTIHPNHHGAIEFLTKDRQTLDSFVSRVKRLMTTSQKLNHLLSEGTSEEDNFIFRDPLTQAYNRAYFEESLRREVVHANRRRQDTSLLMVDIDQFKNIVEDEGRYFGDQYLKRLAKLVNSCVREGDIVARYEEDRFAILLSHCSRQDAINCAKRILKKSKSEFFPEHVTVSVGVMHYKGSSKVGRPETMVAFAKKALDVAHKAGGAQYHFVA